MLSFYSINDIEMRWFCAQDRIRKQNYILTAMRFQKNLFKAYDGLESSDFASLLTELLLADYQLTHYFARVSSPLDMGDTTHGGHHSG